MQLNEEKRTAQRLRDSIKHARDCSDSSTWSEYDQVLSTADSLIYYFTRMADVLENTAIDAIHFQREIERVVQDSTDRVKKSSGMMDLAPY